MKIAQICHQYYPHIGGVEEHVRNVSEQLVRDNEITVLTTDPSGKYPSEEMVNGVVVRRFKAWAPNDAYFFSRELFNYLNKNINDFDIAHVHNYHAFPAVHAACAKKKVKMVFTPHFHGKGSTFFRSVLNIPYKLFAKDIFEKADFVVCVSRFEKSLVQKSFDLSEGRMTVIPNGVNLEEFRDVGRYEKNDAMMLYVGRLEKYKRVHYLIRALSGLDENIVLEIVGTGPYKAFLINLARALGVENRVSFSEGLSRAELLRRYAVAGLFVTLSMNEAYGIAVAEALASGTPCVVADNSALHDWIDGKNCFGVASNLDMEVLRKLIVETIGRKVSGVHLTSWFEVAGELQSLYESLLQSV